MKRRSIFISLIGFLLLFSCSARDVKQQKQLGKSNELNAEEIRVIVNKGTERPFSGKYDKFYEKGIYTCKRCNAALFNSIAKFNSKTGWPSFDDAISGSVREEKDGAYKEIVCANCSGHLGHVFKGEGFTKKNTRHCVNSVSISFTAEKKLGRAIFASGCFWGTEHFLQRAKGVISTTVGYTGGYVDKPTYKQVCSGRTGHAEAVEVIYDKNITNYEKLCKIFFETHDPGQLNRQGPDRGTQYRSGVFYIDEGQKKIAQKLIKQLTDKKVKVVTEITKSEKFYKAEGYHQNWYLKVNKKPYCHFYKKKF